MPTFRLASRPGLATVVLIALIPVASHAAAVWGIGGMQSCATWLSSPENERDGINWMQGFWSGKNTENPRNPMVGRNTDTLGLVAEVKLICQAEPSALLWDAVVRVYMKMEAAAAKH